MFFRTSGFKKLLKEAYKHRGLHVGNTGKSIYLASDWWVLEIRLGEIPKEKLAAIIELVGELPEEGTGFLATKDALQYEFIQNDLYEVIANAGKCTYPLRVTKVSIDGFRVLQHEETRTITTIRDDIVDMISGREADADSGHTPPEGPAAGRLPGVFWENNVMAFYVMPAECDTRLIHYLENIRIEEDDPHGKQDDISEDPGAEETEEA